MPTLVVITGAPSEDDRSSWLAGVPRGSPSDGGYVHAVTASDAFNLPANSPGPWWPGMIYRVDAATSFSSGTQLATNGNGQVRPASAGDVLVATALESSPGSGSTIWVVAETQREV